MTEEKASADWHEDYFELDALPSFVTVEALVEHLAEWLFDTAKDYAMEGGAYSMFYEAYGENWQNSARWRNEAGKLVATCRSASA